MATETPIPIPYQVVGFALTPGRLLEAALTARGFGAWGWRGRSIVFGVHVTAQTAKDQLRQVFSPPSDSC
jgi:hypothetical protein